MLRVLTLAVLQVVRLPIVGVWYLTGWRMEALLPAQLDQYIVTAVPHTTNWDYWHMLCMALICHRRPHVTAKKELFRFPVGFFLRAFGGIPIDRSKSSNMIDQVANMFAQHPRFIIVFTVEGSRKYTEHWRTGFYYAALKANVPIVLGYLDYKRKRSGGDYVFYPTGDLEADFAVIKAYYEEKGRNGLYPEKVSAIALKPRTPEESVS